MWISKNSKLNKRNQTQKITYCMLPYPCVRKIPWKRTWQSTPVFFAEKSHGQRSLVSYSPWVAKESDMTEWLHFHFSLPELEKQIASHSSVLAWRIPEMVEPGGLPSVGSHRVGHNWSDLVVVALDLREVNCKGAWGNFLVWWKCSMSWLEWLLHEHIHLSSNHTFKWVYFIACTLYLNNFNL